MAPGSPIFDLGSSMTCFAYHQAEPHISSLSMSLPQTGQSQLCGVEDDNKVRPFVNFFSGYMR
jgi:hypothetical protein